MLCKQLATNYGMEQNSATRSPETFYHFTLLLFHHDQKRSN
jgi:hypothetical protein